MKPRKHIIIAAVVIALLSVGVWFVKITSPIFRPVGNSNASEGNVPEVGKQESDSFTIVSDTTTSTGRLVVVRHNGQEKRIELPPNVVFSNDDLKEMVSPIQTPIPPVSRAGATRNRHLHFYGLAIDEQTNALAGVNVEGSILVMPGTGSQRLMKRTITGQDGRFALDAEWGQSIMITVNKPDYLAPPVEIYQYGPIGNRPIHNPNINDPLVFMLHKKKAAEPLIVFSHTFRAPNDGQTVRIDLSTGQMVQAGGDLLVSIYCPEPYTELRRFPWKMSVQVSEGSLVADTATRLEYMQEAPLSIVEPGFAVEYDEASKNYRVQHEGMFYVKSRSGQIYSKMYFWMNTRWDERGVPFHIKAVVNTNASRNLQIDPSKIPLH